MIAVLGVLLNYDHFYKFCIYDAGVEWVHREFQNQHSIKALRERVKVSQHEDKAGRFIYYQNYILHDIDIVRLHKETHGRIQRFEVFEGGNEGYKVVLICNDVQEIIVKFFSIEEYIKIVNYLHDLHKEQYPSYYSKEEDVYVN